MTPTVDFDGGVKRSQSSNLVSKHSHDLLGLFNTQDPGEPIVQVSKGLSKCLICNGFFKIDTYLIIERLFFIFDQC